MDNKAKDEIEIDLLDLLYLLQSKLWILALSAISLAVIAGLISILILTPVYTSKSKIYILNKTNTTTSLSDIQVGTQLTQDYLVLVKSRPVVTQVIENLDLDTTYEELANYITVTNQNNTRILEIKVEYPNAYLAKQLADEFAKVSTEQIAKIMDTEKPSIVEEGHVPSEPSSPNVMRNTILGAIIGLVVSAAIIIIIHLMDDTIKDSDDIEKYLGLSTLAMIPIEAGTQKATELTKKKRKKQNRNAKKRPVDKKGIR